MTTALGPSPTDQTICHRPPGAGESPDTFLDG